MQELTQIPLSTQGAPRSPAGTPGGFVRTSPAARLLLRSIEHESGPLVLLHLPRTGPVAQVGWLPLVAFKEDDRLVLWGAADAYPYFLPRRCQAQLAGHLIELDAEMEADSAGEPYTGFHLVARSRPLPVVRSLDPLGRELSEDRPNKGIHPNLRSTGDTL